MIEVGVAIRVYSDLNDHIDLMFFVEGEDMDEAKMVIKTAWDEWWEDDEVSQIPIGDYISDQLDDAGIGFEMFWKEDGLYEND